MFAQQSLQPKLSRRRNVSVSYALQNRITAEQNNMRLLAQSAVWVDPCWLCSSLSDFII